MEWAAHMERMTRLQLLVRFKEALVNKGILDNLEEVASANRMYKEVMGPTQSMTKREIAEKAVREAVDISKLEWKNIDVKYLIRYVSLVVDRQKLVDKKLDDM